MTTSPTTNNHQPRRHPHRRRLVVALLAAVLLLGACGDDGARSDDPATDADGRFAPYVGLSVEEATLRAEDEGRPSRVVRVDGEDLAVTMDYVEDRLNFEVVGGTVTAVTTG